jgi:hypothetical protein
LEMHAPIQKIRNGRCRKTARGFIMAKRDNALGLSDIKDSQQFNRHKNNLPVCGLRVVSACHFMPSGNIVKINMATDR